MFLTSGIAHGADNPALHVLCYDAASGQLVWSTEIFGGADAPPRPQHEKSLPASPTPVVAGERVYVYFGHHGAACLDRAGKIIWRNPRVRFDPAQGSASSPIVAAHRLIYLAEGATSPAIVALDTGTGKTLWRVPRAPAAKVRVSFTAPLLIVTGGRLQLIVTGSAAVSALDLEDGRELWRVRFSDGASVAPQPVFAHGLLFVAAGNTRAELFAIRPDGQGDVTDTHVAWRTTKGAPMTPALVAVGDELYGINDWGVASCWDARTGKVHWQERIDGNFTAAPLAADGRIYFQSETGTGTVVQAARQFAKLATNELGEPTLASYAVAENALFIRTAAHLYRIEARP